jgi:ADP-heptose:LPS heptosyltransferase
MNEFKKIIDYCKAIPFYFHKDKIVIRRFSTALGDSLLLTPVIRELKNKYNKPIVLEAMKKEIFFKNPNISLLLEAKVFKQFFKPQYFIPTKTKYTHIIDQLLDSVGVEPNESKRYLDFYFISNSLPKLIPNKYICVCPVGKQTFAKNIKEWGINNFQKVRDSLPEYNFVQIGTKNDKLLSNVIDMRGLSIQNTANIIKKAETNIFLEGGFMHLANAVKAKSAIIIYGGAINPIYTAYKNFLNIATNVNCNYCFKSHGGNDFCDHMTCMKIISPDFITSLIKNKEYLKPVTLVIE